MTAGSVTGAGPGTAAGDPTARPTVFPTVLHTVVPASSRWWGVPVAGGLSLLAGAIHLYFTPEHLEEWWVFGCFFLAVTVGQVVLAELVVLRPSTRTLLAGIWGNVAVIATYLVSRTVGLPIGPPHGVHGADGQMLGHQPVAGGIGNGMPVLPATESATATHLDVVGRLDLWVLGLELALVVLLVMMLPPRHRRVTLNAFLVLGLLAWGTRIAASVVS